MRKRAKLTPSVHQPIAPGPKAIGIEARQYLGEAIKDLKAEEGPHVDEALKRIRYAYELLEALDL